MCRRRRVPPDRLDGVALGRQRLGVNVLSRVRHVAEEGRLPIRSIQWYLRTVHQLSLSVGAIVSAIHQTAQQAQPAVAAMVDRNRASRVHADETGWRQGKQRLRVRALDQSLSAPPPSATSCGGVGARRWWTKRWARHSRSTGQRFLRCLPPLRWPQAAVLGAPAAGHATTWWPSSQGTSLARWNCRGIGVHRLYVEARSFTHLRHDDGAPLNWPGAEAAGSPSWLTR